MPRPSFPRISRPLPYTCYRRFSFAGNIFPRGQQPLWHPRLSGRRYHVFTICASDIKHPSLFTSPVKMPRWRKARELWKFARVFLSSFLLQAYVIGVSVLAIFAESAGFYFVGEFCVKRDTRREKELSSSGLAARDTVWFMVPTAEVIQCDSVNAVIHWEDDLCLSGVRYKNARERFLLFIFLLHFSFVTATLR